ncbi:MAG: YraN family protein [candidate division WOR-3 bacterium]
MKNKLKEGHKGEDLVLKEYFKKGYKLLDRNVYFRGGEIDLILKKDNLIVFVEVKKRKKGDFLLGIQSINKKKIDRIIKFSKIYLERKNLYEKVDVRFDVAIIEGENLNILENAFYEGFNL